VTDPTPAVGVVTAGPGWLTGPRRRVLDLGLRIAGLFVATALAAVSAVYEVFLTPLYWHGTRLPLALALAVFGNAGLAWFVQEVTGRIGAILAPAAVWFLLVFVAGNGTREGDLGISSKNWVGVTTMLAGAAAFAIVGYGMVFRSARRLPAPDENVATSLPTRSGVRRGIQDKRKDRTRR
jgi:hypothetical protein